MCSCPAVPGDNNGASLCDWADDQVLPILLLGVALAIACFLAAAHILLPAGVKLTVKQWISMDSSPPMFGTSRPRPASSAALTRLRHHCEEAGSAGTTIHLGFLPQVGSPTARGAVPETLELSSSVTTALEALSPWLMKPSRSLHDVMNCMDTARSRRLDGGPTSSEAKTTESSRVMSCSVEPSAGLP